jgi:hypothetical protein
VFICDLALLSNPMKTAHQSPFTVAWLSVAAYRGDTRREPYMVWLAKRALLV